MVHTGVMGTAGMLLPPLLALSAVAIVSAGMFAPPATVSWPDGVPAVETVRVPAGTFAYREPGTFMLEGHEIDAPTTLERVSATLEVMKYQVSAAHYALCVAEEACAPVDKHLNMASDLPVTGVSYLDAQAYAQWFSAATGQTWRLPTDLEWVRFAGLDFEPAVGADGGRSVADGWLDSYRRMAARDRMADAEVRRAGYFGANALGVADAGGNVWEWTQTCLQRVSLTVSGNMMSRFESCGVRVLQGRHRAYMSAFIRDAVSGGCSVGTPPDHLGFRLVRQVRWHEVLPRPFA